MTESLPMTEQSVCQMLEEAGARAMSRGGRSDNYGAPREYSFEVRAAFPNGLMLNIIARQYDYRDPWEATGRVNELVDVALLRDGRHSTLPRGYEWFQNRDEEEGVIAEELQLIVDCVKDLNPKLFALQKLTGDL